MTDRPLQPVLLIMPQGHSVLEDHPQTQLCLEVFNVINNNNPPVHQLQHVQGAPISLYTCTNAEQMAFPWLFPDGTNGYRTS